MVAALVENKKCMGFCREKSGRNNKVTIRRGSTVFANQELLVGLINKVDMVCLSPVGYGV